MDVVFCFYCTDRYIGIPNYLFGEELMKRTQIWCDNCGREIQDKRTGNGSEHSMTIDNIDKSWELWSPAGGEDSVLCGLKCVVETAQALMEEGKK